MKKELKLYYSKDFDYTNAFFSQTAIKNNIYNITNDKQIVCNILFSIKMFENVYQAIKKKYPWVKRSDFEITSFFRCKALNNLVGGTSTSDHLFGKAIDFKVKGLTSKQICEAIYENCLIFDQLIQEPTWVHISFENIVFKNKKHYLIKTNNIYKRIDY